MPYFEYSFFPETAEELNIPWLPSIDKARDLVHPGIESNKKAAERIYQDIRTNDSQYQNNS